MQGTQDYSIDLKINNLNFPCSSFLLINHPTQPTTSNEKGQQLPPPSVPNSFTALKITAYAGKRQLSQFRVLSNSHASKVLSNSHPHRERKKKKKHLVNFGFYFILLVFLKYSKVIVPIWVSIPKLQKLNKMVKPDTYQESKGKRGAMAMLAILLSC